MKRAGTNHLQRGFSLTEVLVAAGIMGVISVGMISIQRTGSLGQKSLLAQDDARNLTDGIASMLSDPTACTNTFGGKNPVAGITMNASPDAIKDKDGTPRFTFGNIYGNRTVKIKRAVVGGGAVDDPLFHIRKWTPSGNPQQGSALVVLDWEQTGDGTNRAIGVKVLSRYFLINATLDASSAISSCYALTGTTASAGSGTPNYLAKWVSTTNLADSSVVQSATGSNIGMGISPVNKLDVYGGMAVGSFAGSSAAPANGLIVSGSVGLGTSNPINKLDIYGGMAVGTTYAGVSTAPANGLIVGGSVAVGTSSAAADTGAGGLTINSAGNAQLVAQKNNVQGFRLQTSNLLSGDFVLADKVGGTWNNSLFSSGSSIGIGTAPKGKFYVSGDAKIGSTDAVVSIFSPSNTLVALQGQSAANPAQKRDIALNPGAGNVAIGTTSTQYKLTLNGDAIGNNWYTPSDSRLKNILGKIPNACEKLEKINGYYFTWKNGEDHSAQIGVMAQELEAVFPELVTTAANGLKAVDYAKLNAVLVEAAKEINGRLKENADRLKSQEEALGSQNSIFQKNSQEILRLQKALNISGGLGNKSQAQSSSASEFQASLEELKKQNLQLLQENKRLQEKMDALKAYVCARDRSAQLCE